MSGKSKISPQMMAKFAHLRKKSVKALRAEWSVGAVSRAYGIPPRIVTQWRDEEKIEAPKGKCRPTPAPGEELA